MGADGQGSYCDSITVKLEVYLDGLRSLMNLLEGGYDFSLALVDNIEL